VTALALLILRLAVGLTLAGHGAQKLFGWWGGTGMVGWTESVNKLRIRPARPFAWIAALAELIGGLLVALGLLSPLGSFAIAGAMAVAVATVHLSRGFWASKGGYEFNLLIVAAVATLALTGPGTYSIDQLLQVRFPEPLTLFALSVVTVLGIGATLGSRWAAERRKPETA
jgi:putative oxidoreductase